MLHSFLLVQQICILCAEVINTALNAHTTLSQPLPSQETDMVFVVEPAVVAVATQQPNTVHSAWLSLSITRISHFSL